jgi:hypothetical protein
MDMGVMGALHMIDQHDIIIVYTIEGGLLQTESFRPS